MSDDLKAAAKKLFDEGKIDILVGYEKGSVPLRTTPCFIRSADDVDKLVWDGFCSNNLAVYLPRLFSREGRPKGWQPPRVAVVAKGCDGRSLVGLLNVELDALSFLECAEAITTDRGEMDENVLAHIAGDESVPLGIAEPLDCPSFSLAHL